MVSLDITPKLVTFFPLEAVTGSSSRLTWRTVASRISPAEGAYQANNPDVAQLSKTAWSPERNQGETSVLVRAAGLTASTTVGVIGPLVADYPQVPRANFIDEYVFSKLRRFQIVPSDLSSDSEFLRRICLDLTGTFPPPERVREFLASKDPKKREKLIDTLIATPEFVDYWTFRFSDLFRVSVFPNGLSPKWSDMYWRWLRDSIASNKPYDQMARERLAAQGYDAPSRHYLPYTVISPPSEIMAEEVRVFLRPASRLRPMP